MLLAFLESASRGSSWQRCPMLRLIHLVHGLSYPRCQRMAFKGGNANKPSRLREHHHRRREAIEAAPTEARNSFEILHTRSQVMC